MVAGIAVLMLGTIGGLGMIASAGVEPTNRFMTRHPRVKEFFGWEEDEPDEDDKKAPAAATAEASEPNQNIIYLSLSHQQPTRKAVK
ncbi:hypothetical protein [Lacticaseibacillus parakribbianus]|uniref:hypothetical protein n=1 Tax=Lacticaseibacillus parakribbianus TaxID=2970927 RepID=UPI0021CB5505|nr:hypothetical protein [Lacticaseibacillus parakribbianus]